MSAAAAFRAGAALAALAALLVGGPGFAEGLPKRVGACALTRVKEVTNRLVDAATNQPTPGSGSAIAYENGGYQVSYDQIRAGDQSRPGDKVRLCLVSLPQNCPPGDDRGRTYRAINLRTHGVWTLPDSEHMCGGA